MEVNAHDLFAKEKIGSLKEVRLEEKLKKAQADVEAAKASGQNGAELEQKIESLRQEEAQFLKFRVEEYERRVKAHPTDYELKLKYGNILVQARQFDDAIKEFQKAVKDPKFKILSLNSIGNCFKEKGLYDLAEQQYKEALNSVADKDSELGKEIKYNLGVVSEKKGNSEGALDWYQKIMAVDIGYRDVSARVSALMSGVPPR